MREIVLDTETTGLDARRGDRLVEIGCIEIVNRIATGREFHSFLNPERDVHPEAMAVHGLTNEFLADKPKFADVADQFLAFIGEDPLVIHNAAFDITFINTELERLPRKPLGQERLVDTLVLARRKHPMGPNTLDALCKRYGIDNSKRIKHGALMDSLLLAEVYIELLGERQTVLGLTVADIPASRADGGMVAIRRRPEPLPSRLSAQDEDRHRAFVATLGEDPLWRRYLEQADDPAVAVKP
ncbi:MAG: DNA polymerase III subunit epsilon [Hyphomicrobiaceae bacterium]